MKTIKDIFIMCREFWRYDETCLHSVCGHCTKEDVCAMQLYAIHDLIKAGEYH